MRKFKKIETSCTCRNVDTYQTCLDGVKYMTVREGIKVILSTTVLPLDGTYRITTISPYGVEKLVDGVQHYIGHPATKTIVEKMGAVQAPSKLFEGLDRGETALAVSIMQGRSTRGTLGKTVDQDVVLDDLHFRIIKRL